MKNYKLNATAIKQLISPMGACIASDMITVEGLSVGYMYREEPDFEGDSGWRFFSGTETQEYIDNVDNMAIYDVNTIANYDSTIIEHLSHAEGIELMRGEDGVFIIVEKE